MGKILKRLGASVREYKAPSILAPVFVILEVVMEVVIPLLMAKMIDNGINKGNMKYIVFLGIGLLVSAIASLLFGVMAGNKAAEASAGFAKNLRKDMYYNVQNYSFSNIDKFSTASIVTRLTTDVTNIQNAYQMIIRMAVRAPIMLIVCLCVSFSINAKLALIFAGVIPVLAIGLTFISTKVHPVFKRVFKTYDKLNNVVQENLHGIRVVKSFVREDYEIKKFEDISQNIYKDFSWAEKILAFNMPIMQTCMYTCMLLISWIGARLIVAGGNASGAGLTTGELVSFIQYSMMILMSLMMLSMIFVMVILSRASAERIAEILDEKSDIKNLQNPVYDVKDGRITFENVSFAYRSDADKLCLDNIHIDIASGETVGINGGTGASKTTFVNLIPRLYDVTKGAVKVGGLNVREYDIEALREQVSVVLQKNELFSGTIFENLRWGNENATDEECIEQGGTNVSGGQKQRICIARALLKKPRILILDDSTSAVDTKTDALIRKAFKEEIPDTTKLIIAQRISSVQDADKIIVMDDGRISAVGKHEELLLNSSIYREVYESQVKGGDDNE